MHNLMNLKREKSEMGYLSDYPHFYEIIKDGTNEPMLFATRVSENGDFILSTHKDVFCQYGPNYVGVVRANMLGTRFEVFNYGVEQKY